MKKMLIDEDVNKMTADENDLEFIANELLKHSNKIGRSIIVNEYINFSVGEQFGIFFNDNQIKNILVNFLRTDFLQNQVFIRANLTRKTPKHFILTFNVNGKKIKLDATLLKQHWKKYLQNKLSLTNEQKYMKKTIRLTENDLHNIVRKCVNEQIKRRLNEGSPNPDDCEKWEQIKEMLGADKMLDEIFAELDADTINSLISDIDRFYELGLFQDEDYEDEDF